MIDRLESNLREIEDWVSQPPELSELQSDDEFMTVLTRAMNFTLYLLRVAPSLTRGAREAETGVLLYRAVPVGLMVRLAKLYHGLLDVACKNRLEWASVFWRPLYETDVRLHYILSAPQSHRVRRSYIETSHREIRERLDDLLGKARSRALVPIERRMLEGMRSTLRRDRVSARALRKRKSWELDGKNVRELLRALGREKEYAYIYGTASRFQHGSWAEVSFYHLTKTGRRYQPRLVFAPVDPRLAAPLTTICLRATARYLRWARPSGWQYVCKLALALETFVMRLDDAHEKIFAKRARA